MAVAYTCDGCGTNVDKPMQVGHVIKRDYCEGCAAKAKAFLEAEEKLRVETQQAFIAARNGLIEVLSKDDFKLPDIP